MHALVTRETHQMPIVLEPRTRLRCESQLRVAAATVARSGAAEVNAATTIGVLGADDVSAFDGLVRQLTHEYGLEARVRLHVGSFAVRFTPSV